MQKFSEQFGEDGIFHTETRGQFLCANYSAYCQLKAIDYTDSEIAEQFYCSLEELESLKSVFE